MSYILDEFHLQGLSPFGRIEALGNLITLHRSRITSVAFTRLDPTKALAFPGWIVLLNLYLQRHDSPLVPLVYLMTPWHDPRNIDAVKYVEAFAQKVGLQGFQITVEQPLFTSEDIDLGMQRINHTTGEEAGARIQDILDRPLGQGDADMIVSWIDSLGLPTEVAKTLYAYLFKELPGRRIRDQFCSPLLEFSGILSDRAVAGSSHIFTPHGGGYTVSPLADIDTVRNCTLAHRMGIGNHPLFDTLENMQDYPGQRDETGFHAVCGFNPHEVLGDGEGI